MEQEVRSLSTGVRGGRNEKLIEKCDDGEPDERAVRPPQISCLSHPLPLLSETGRSVRTAALSARFILSLRSAIVDAGWFPSSEPSRREDLLRVERAWLTWRLLPAKVLPPHPPLPFLLPADYQQRTGREEPAELMGGLDKVVRMTPVDVSSSFAVSCAAADDQQGGGDGRSVAEMLRLLKRDEKM
eukprot:758496-Hanusia_phi.AAC.3